MGSGETLGVSTLPARRKRRLDAEQREIKTGESWGRFRSYYIDDSNPETNKTALAREPIDPTRYRVSLQDRTYLTEDIYTTIDINKLSDRRFLQDFEPGEFRQNPNPDNMIAHHEVGRGLHAHAHGAQTAQRGLRRHREAARSSPSTSSASRSSAMRRSSTIARRASGICGAISPTTRIFPDYESFRADTFHQLAYPGTYFGWLSVVPHVGVRGTYYSDSGLHRGHGRSTDTTR